MVYLECQGENPGLCRSYHLSRTIGCQLAETKLFDAKARLEIHTLFKKGTLAWKLEVNDKICSQKDPTIKMISAIERNSGKL